MEAEKHLRISNIFPPVWGALVICGLIFGLLLAPACSYDIYDVQAGLRAYSQQPLLAVGAQIVFAGVGIVMILMVLSFHEGFMHYDKSYSTRAATVFGLVSGSLFLFYGLVGGFSSFDLIYIQSTRSAAYVQDAYLPLVLIANRTLAAAITVSGFGSAWLICSSCASNLCRHSWRIWESEQAGLLCLDSFYLLCLFLGFVWGIFSGLSLRIREQQYNLDKS
jgi:hypothetical protein